MRSVRVRDVRVRPMGVRAVRVMWVVRVVWVMRVVRVVAVRSVAMRSVGVRPVAVRYMRVVTVRQVAVRSAESTHTATLIRVAGAGRIGTAAAVMVDWTSTRAATARHIGRMAMRQMAVW